MFMSTWVQPSELVRSLSRVPERAVRRKGRIVRSRLWRRHLVLLDLHGQRSGGYPQIAVVDKSGKFAYVSNFDDSSVSEYTISAGGVLAPIGSVPSGGSNPHSLVISPGGFLYCANVNLQLVSEFSINSSTGVLTLINTYTVGLGGPLDTGALWISFDPTGKHAYIGTLAEIAQFTVGGG